MQLYATFDHPFAYRYWRRRAGWSANETFLYLCAPIEVPDKEWEQLDSYLSHLSRSVEFDRTPRSELVLPLFIVARANLTPADNVDDFLIKATNTVPKLLPYADTVADLIVTPDRVALCPPRTSKFLDGIGALHDSYAQLGGNLSECDPFHVSIDVAYCRTDGVWPKSLLEDAPSLPEFIPVSASAVTVSSITLGHSKYIRNTIHKISTEDVQGAPPDGLVRRFTRRKDQQEQDEQEIPSPKAESYIVWHADSDFAFKAPERSESAHELADFVQKSSSELQAEYRRIQRRVKEDPGTAGDEGEEDWKEIFEHWLPANYPIVTKGRILTRDGLASPQLDLLVLDPAYPKALRGRKLYLAEGVLAAFECKLTLRKKHFKKIVAAARFIGDNCINMRGDVDDESAVRSRPIFGVLAHSSEWSRSAGIDVVRRELGAILRSEMHPREAIDLLCIADNCTWTYEIMKMGPDMQTDHGRMLYRAGPEPVLHTEYLRWQSGEGDVNPVAPLYTLIGRLWGLLAAGDESLSDFAWYLRAVHIPGVIGNFGVARTWPMDILRGQRD